MLNKKSFPLTGAQELILQQQKYSLDKSISNINIMVHFEGEINDELMLQSLSLALLRNPSVSFQVRKSSGKNYEQYFANKTPQPIEIVDFNNSSEEELRSYLIKEGTKAFPNKSYDVPLYKIKYIIKPDGKRGVYFVINHMTLDAYAMIFMVEDAFNIYDALCEGRSLPKPFRSSLSLFDREKEYLESPNHKRDLAFWDDVFKDEPLYNSLHPAGSKDYIPNKRTGKSGFLGLKTKSKSWLGKIPFELVSKTEQFAQEHSVTMQSLYMLPIRNAHSRANNFSEDIMFMNLVAHRATLLEKQAGGSRVSPILLRLKFGNELSFLEAANEMTRLYTSYYKHSKCSYMMMYKNLTQRFKDTSLTKGYGSTGITFQPYALKERANLPIRIEYVSNGQSAQGLYITFMYLDNSGDLYGIYEYNLKLYKTPELIEKLHLHLVNSLSYAMDNPDVTLQELMEKF